MTDTDFHLIELTWCSMTPMEKALWGTAVALNSQDTDGGLAAADAAITKLRSFAGVRSHRPEPEYEAARANVYMEYEEFATWYAVEFRIRHTFDRDHRSPSPDEVKAAYERYARGRYDFY
jgi:hypothetical protein